MSLELRDVTVRFGAMTAVDGVDLRAAPGEVLAVLGPNGCGKSTLLRAIAELVAAQGDISRGTGRCFYLPQDNFARAALTAFEVVLLGRVRSLALRPGAADLAAAAGALAELGVGALAGRRIGVLSGGQRQLVFLAQVLAADPAFLLLDEPTSALDLAHQMQVLELLRAVTRRRGLTTIAVLHDLNAAGRFADRVAVMQAGRIVAEGAPATVLCGAVLERVYGVRVAVIDGPDGRPVVVPLGAV